MGDTHLHRSTDCRCIMTVLFLVILTLGQLPLIGSAQTVTTSITPSALPSCTAPCGSGVTTVMQNVTTYDITGGARPGDGTNLFHSFMTFSVGAPDTANFVNDQNLATTNIVSRVTGGQVSNIFGTLQTTGFGTAALWLINPAGVVFGSGASLNVGGSVHFSTADYLRMFDGVTSSYFYADLSKNSQLTSAPVTAFGFLGSNPVAAQAIEVQGNLSLAGANSLSLVGRDIATGTTTISGITVDGGRIDNPSGRINLVSVGTPLNPNAGGEASAIDFNPASASSGRGFAGLGSILMTDGDLTVTNVVSRSAVGEIVIRGGQLTMEGGSRILAITTDGNTVQGGIDIALTGAMTLSGGQTAISTENTGSATIPGADILIQAGLLSVTDGAQIRTTNNSQNQVAPRGGNIDLTVDTITLSGVIDAGEAVSSGVFSGTASDTRGSGGDIRVTANRVDILDGAKIDASTLGTGNAGTIDISATEVLLSGVNTTNSYTDAPSTISSKAAIDPNSEGLTANELTGDGGNIAITTSTLTILDGAQLNASTATAGDAGSIDVTADIITIAGGQGVQRSGISTDTKSTGSPAGAGGNVILTASTLDLQDGAIIDLSTHSDAAAGNLTVYAGNVTLSNGSSIQSFSQGTGGIAGSGGILSMTANTLSLSDSTLSTRANASGDGGSIVINAGNVTLLDPTAKIDSGTISTGSGGNIILNASNRLVVQEGAVTTSSSGNGNAGTVQVSADQVVLSGGGEISSSTTSSGNGGTVSVAGAGSTGLVQLSGGSIKAATTGSGNAGNVIVTGNTVTVTGADSTIDTSTTSAGNAGNIQIQAGQVSLESSGTISSASLAPATGNAGSVTITTTGQFQSIGGNVTTSAVNGQGGNITIRADEIQLNGGGSIAASTSGPLDAGDILLVAGDRIMLQDSRVTTSADVASGGNITLLAPNLIRLRNGQIISSVAGGAETRGGNITIDPQAMLLQNNSQILAQAFQGNGGNISITAGVLIVDPSSLIDATSQLGINGQVSVQAPIQSLAGLMTPLPQSFVNSANLYGQRCAAQKGGQFSSFVQGTRDGLPVQPGDFIPSPLIPDRSGFSPGQTGRSEQPSLIAARLGLQPIEQFPATPLVLYSGCRS